MFVAERGVLIRSGHGINMWDAGSPIGDPNAKKAVGWKFRTG